VRGVVCDTSVLLHLTEADALPVLMRMGDIVVPRAVVTEMTQYSPLWLTEKPSWIHVQSLTDPFLKEAMAWRQAGLLDSGEAEAIALARQITAAWLLTDDAAARLFAQSLGIEVHGSLGVVLWAAAVRELSRTDAEAMLDRLAESSLWISARVLAEARRALRQLYRGRKSERQKD
jgi:predicted nucleic acid-binding protein